VSEPTTILGYAGPATSAPRRWCRNAVRALAWVLAYPLLVGAPLIYAADNNWLPQHFLCCRHPEVTFLAFVATPFVGGALGVISLVQIRLDKSRPRQRGVCAASLSILFGAVFILFGIGLFFALKA
jgi:hypothetical protein